MGDRFDASVRIRSTRRWTRRAPGRLSSMSTTSILRMPLTSTSSLSVSETSKQGTLASLDQPVSLGFEWLISWCHRKRAEIPIYSFEKHQRLEKTTSIYSPHVLIVEGIFALYDARVLELLDMKVWVSSYIQPTQKMCLQNHRSFAKPMQIRACHGES